MPIDNSVIDENLTKLNTEISTVNGTLKTLVALKSAFTKIQIFQKRVTNDTGGYDIIPTVPNPNGLSDEDNEQVRQIIYDDSVEKISELDL